MKILEVTPDKKLTLKDHISGQLKKGYAKSAALTAISRKVVRQNVHATTPKGNMGYDQYTCC